MKFQMKLLALAAMSLAMAAPAAHAAIDNGSASGNGELFFSLWSDNGTAGNTADDVSYTRDLGVHINDWASAVNTPVLSAAKTTAGYMQSFSADSLLTSFLGAIPAGAKVLWNVVGVDNFGSAKRFVSTAAAGTSALPTQPAGNSVNVETAISSFADAVNPMADTQNNTPSSTTAVNNSNTATFGDATAFAGNPSLFGTNLGGKTLFNTTGGIGDKLPFFLQYHVGATGNASSKSFGTAGVTDAYWTLNNAGALSYNVAAVPEADTWAMLLAGLGMMGFIARRRLQG